MKCRISKQHGLRTGLVLLFLTFAALFGIGVWVSTETVPKAVYIYEYETGLCKHYGTDIKVNDNYLCSNVTSPPKVIEYQCYYHPSQKCTTLTDLKPTVDSLTVDHLIGGIVMWFLGAIGIFVAIVLYSRLRMPIDSHQSFQADSNVFGSSIDL